MRSMSLGGLTSRRAGASAGWALSALSALLSLPTILALQGAPRLVVGAIFAGNLAVASVLLLLPWERLPRWLLLTWPLTQLVTVAAAGLITPKQSVSTLTGITILAFFHVGQFQRRHTGPALTPVAFLALVCGYGGWSHQLALRAPITLGVWVIISEAMARLRLQAQTLADALEALAATDHLTGLATRHVLRERLPLAEPGDAAVIIDIDHFKRVNDEQGHLAGDTILSDLGLVLLASLRDGDLAVRFGGEELLLLLRGAGLDGARATLSRIRTSWHEIHPDITFSAGIALFAEGRDSTAVLAAADRALYRAKHAGRDRWLEEVA